MPLPPPVQPARGVSGSVLHVVVGHEQPTYFLNAIRSVRACAPSDPLLVIDNASTHRGLRRALRQIEAEDDLVEVVLRGSNDTRLNGKVGELYLAYAEAFAAATARGYDLLHLVQADFQVLWWDDELVARSLALFEAHPRCVNLFTQLLSRDVELAETLVPSSTPGVLALRGYGLTDTGIYHLERWRRFGMRFDADETLHAARYLRDGYEVLCHPWPVDAAIPWPSVVRGGVERGREVRRREAFLLRPLDDAAVVRLKAAHPPGRHEDFAIPWGWLSLAPVWATDADALGYWVLRYRQARRDGVAAALPRLDRRGVPAGSWLWLLLTYQHRPPLGRLFLMAPLKAAWRRWKGRRAPATASGHRSRGSRRPRGRRRQGWHRRAAR